MGFNSGFKGLITFTNKVILLYVFFWVIPRRLNFICRRFGTLCSIFIGRSLVLLLSSQNPPIRFFFYEQTDGVATGSPLSPVIANFFMEDFEKKTIEQGTCLWRWNRQSVPKRRHIKFRRQGITKKKTYNIQNKAKVWNQEAHFVLTYNESCDLVIPPKMLCE